MSEPVWRFEPALDKPNPFQVLALPTDATKGDIVERGKDLSDGAESKEQALLYRWAMEQLITHPLTRFTYELLEVPGAQYEDEDWARFVRSHKRSPIDLAAMAREAPPPVLADFHLAKLIALLLDGLLQVPPPQIQPAVEHSPFAADFGPPPLEIRDVLFG